jgi:hypothetical protein
MNKNEGPLGPFIPLDIIRTKLEKIITSLCKVGDLYC